MKPCAATLYGGLFVAGMILTHVALGLAASLGGSWLENLSGLSRFHKGFEVTGGILLIASGLYLLNAYLMFIPVLAA